MTSPNAEATAPIDGATALPWNEAVEPLCSAVEKRIAATIRSATDRIYEEIMTATQDYLRDNTEYNLGSELSSRQYTIDRLRATVAKHEAEKAALVEALREISEYHIPDQPSHDGGDELSWAQRQHAHLRHIARTALSRASATVGGAG